VPQDEHVHARTQWRDEDFRLLDLLALDLLSLGTPIIHDDDAVRLFQRSLEIQF